MADKCGSCRISRNAFILEEQSYYRPSDRGIQVAVAFVIIYLTALLFGMYCLSNMGHTPQFYLITAACLALSMLFAYLLGECMFQND